MEEVTIVNHAYDPETLNIKAGTEVLFKNEDGDSHTVTADDGTFDSGEITPGTDFHYVFDTPGECGIHCDYHPEMTMRVIVE